MIGAREPVTRRLRSPWGGIAGPALFVAAWAIGGARQPRYSPVDDAISRLAAVGVSSRPLMTTGFVCFGLGMLVYSGAVRAAVPGPAWVAVAGAGAATFGVVAFPLGWSAATDDVHGAFAVTTYAAVVAIPLLASRALAASGHRGLARLSVVTGVAAGLGLAATALGTAPGLLQRAGLTLLDVWLAASAACMVRATHGRATP
jgi:hypothetical membrane protein